jgi:aspartate/tyrosine/aromatic aminotransferase
MKSSGILKRTSSQLSITDFPATRLKLDMLPAVSDSLADSFHARLDEQVLSTIEDESYSPNFGVLLLTTIVTSSEGLLNRKYEITTAAKALLKEHPELAEKLKVAWKDKQFKSIRNLGMFFTLRIYKS